MFRFRDDVGNQSPFTGPVFPNDHDGTIHKRMSSQGSLDLTQFNAEAPNFYLVVAASEELDVSIRKIARHVTSAIHPGAGVTHEGIGNKTFICARGLLQVSCGDSITRNVELSYHADRQRLLLSIEDIHLGVGDRSANRNAGDRCALPVVFGKAQRQRTNGRLRWSVVIQNFAASAQTLNRLQQLGRKGLSPRYQIFAWQDLLRVCSLQQSLQVRRNNLENIERILAAVASEALGISGGFVANHMKASARNQ